MGGYDKLLEPIKIGTNTWKNRIAKGPSSTLFWGPNQYCNDTVINTFEAIAKGGAAAVTIGADISDDPAMLICKDGSSGFTVEDYPFPGLYDDKFISGLGKLADAVVTAFGSKPRSTLAAQLSALDVEVSTVGDARAVRDAFSDVREGFEAGLAV